MNKIRPYLLIQVFFKKIILFHLLPRTVNQSPARFRQAQNRRVNQT
jgi:hypothetical protein